MSIHKLGFEETDVLPGDGGKVADGYFDMIRDVEVELTATIGTTSISIAELFELKKNSVMKLNQMVDDPLDISLNGSVIGKGELVASGDNFAVRILEINNNIKP